MKKVLVALEILVILIIGGGLIFIYSGVYNIAATDAHTGLVRWVLETTRTQSVRNYAEDVQVPPLEQLDRVKGFRHFDEMCVMCHGAPGVERSDVGEGLNPRPPELSEEVKEWTSGELFWIVRHGLKMAGMPAFGPTHKEEDLWSIVAFLRTLPDITPQEYEALRHRYKSSPDETGGHGGHAHGGAAPQQEGQSQ